MITIPIIYIYGIVKILYTNSVSVDITALYEIAHILVYALCSEYEPETLYIGLRSC